jgi:hypothetical protein
MDKATPPVGVTANVLGTARLPLNEKQSLQKAIAAGQTAL